MNAILETQPFDTNGCLEREPATGKVFYRHFDQSRVSDGRYEVDAILWKPQTAGNVACILCGSAALELQLCRGHFEIFRALRHPENDDTITWEQFIDAHDGEHCETCTYTGERPRPLR